MDKITICLEKGMFVTINHPSGEIILRKGECLSIDKKFADDFLKKEIERGVFSVKEEEGQEETQETKTPETTKDEPRVTLSEEKPTVEEGSKEVSKVNINTASIEELEALPGVGEDLAKEIVGFREEHGEFEKLEDLVEIKGIGPKKLENLKQYLTV